MDAQFRPPTPGEKRFAIFLLLVTFAGNGYALWRSVAQPEQLSDAPALVCHTVPIGGMQNRACLGHEPKVVIWGDSTAHAWIPMAQELGLALHEPSTNLARDGCPPLIGADLTLRWPQEAVDCAAWNDEAIAYLRTHGADTLVITARWSHFIQPDIDNGAAAAIARSVAQAAPYVRRILVIAPTPEFAQLHGEVAHAAYDAGAQAARAALHALEANPKVQLVDPSGWFCAGANCQTWRGELSLYSDRFHVSQDAARAFTKDYLRGRLSLTDRGGS